MEKIIGIQKHAGKVWKSKLSEEKKEKKSCLRSWCKIAIKNRNQGYYAKVMSVTGFKG